MAPFNLRRVLIAFLHIATLISFGRCDVDTCWKVFEESSPSSAGNRAEGWSVHRVNIFSISAHHDDAVGRTPFHAKDGAFHVSVLTLAHAQ